jgi:hypothetical protein
MEKYLKANFMMGFLMERVSIQPCLKQRSQGIGNKENILNSLD